ncbi:MAG: hypothetical protein IH904_00135 [Proteobacteria bacterium]|nr:hypothetical protein [Pseudomonadota bacterium]
MIRRFEDWPARLGDALAAAAGTPFEFGKHDCCLAVCDVILAITGTDLAADYRGYEGEAEALAVLRKHRGVVGIMEATAARHAIPEVPPGLAQRGDMVIIDKDGDKALAIVDMTGSRVAAAARAGGWAPRPVSCIERAWRIG